MPLAATADASPASQPTPSRISESRKRSLFMRIADAIGELNRRKAGREIAARFAGRL